MTPRWFGLILLAATGCWGAPPSPEYLQSKATLEAFLQDLVEGRLEAAYARTTQRFQQEHDLDAFKAFLKKNPALLRHQSVDFGNNIHAVSFAENGQVKRMEIRVRLDGSVPLKVILVPDHYGWRVDELDAAPYWDAVDDAVS